MLVGTLQPLTIVAAAGPGPNSIHKPAQFTSDPQSDRACLNDARKEYGQKISSVGWWHKHSGGFNRPSSGDYQQAQQLAKEYNDGQPILMGIVNVLPKLVGKKVLLYLYSIDSNKDLIEHSWKLTASRSSKLLSEIGKAALCPDTKESDYWKDADFQFYLNPVGRERIKTELSNLKNAGWQVKVGKHSKDQVLILDLSGNKSNLRIALPPEYPLNPPTLFTTEGERLFDLRTLSSWNSLNSLTDIANEYVFVRTCIHCKSL